MHCRPARPRSPSTDFDVTVPEDSLWVMGDNRYNSKDSRYNGETPLKGFVPLDDVIGRAFVVCWPTAAWTWLDNYPDVFDGSRRQRLTPPSVSPARGEVALRRGRVRSSRRRGRSWRHRRPVAVGMRGHDPASVACPQGLATRSC